MLPLPPTPYVAVVFVSRRTDHTMADGVSYDDMAAQMEALARAQPGYLGLDTARDATTGVGVTVSYWADEPAARAWKAVAEHARAQRLGRGVWYESYETHVATVHRSYAHPGERV